MKQKPLMLFLCVCWTLGNAQQRLSETTHIGPFNARQRSISLLVDNDNWFLGTDGGGLWFSKNAGETWKPYDTLNGFGGKVYDIHQQDNLIVYSVPPLSTSGIIDPNWGIYVSEDRGRNFRHLIGSGNFDYSLFIKDMEIVNGRIFFQSTDGIYQANLDGSHKVIYSGKVSNMSVTALDENTEAFIFYDGHNGENGGLFFKKTGQLRQKLPFPSGYTYHAAVAPTSGNVVYVVAAAAGSPVNDPTVRRVYKSENHGSPGTYQKVFDGNLDYLWWGSHFINTGVPTFEGVKVLNNPNHLVISSTSMAYSSDGGRTWREKRPSNEIVVFGDMWPNSVVETNDQLILGHDHGLFEGSIDDFFKPINDNSYGRPIRADIKNHCEGIPAFTGYVGDVNENVISIGGQDRGTFLLNGEREIYVGGGDVYMAILLDDESYIFNKHGVSLVERYDLNGNILGFIDFQEDIRTYSGFNQAGKNSKGEIFYADDNSYDPRGSVIIKIREDTYTVMYQAADNVDVFSLAVTEDVSYFLESGAMGANAAYWSIKKLTHANKSIEVIIDDLGNIISDIEICPSNPNILFGFMHGGTENPVRININTQEINSIRGNLPRDVVILSLNSIDETKIFLGTNCGIYVTINGGNHWDYIDKFPCVQVFDIDILNSFLYAFTYGRGALKSTIDNLVDPLPVRTPVLTVDNLVDPLPVRTPVLTVQAEAGIRAYPVPTSNHITLDNIGTYDRVEFFDMVGRKVRTLGNNNKNKMIVHDLPTGTGFVVLTNTKTQKTAKRRIRVN